MWYVKESVYILHTMPLNLHELKICIQDACESVDMQMANVWTEIIILLCVESPVGLTLKSNK